MNIKEQSYCIYYDILYCISSCPITETEGKLSSLLAITSSYKILFLQL